MTLNCSDAIAVCKLSPSESRRMAASLYRQVVQITHSYLGPAADRFITKQIENHLHINPESLERHDLKQLIDWIRVAVSLLTDDAAIIEEYTTSLEALARGTYKKPKQESA